jgi:3-oxoacyl-[acyl-carrier-protein] synthase II
MYITASAAISHQPVFRSKGFSSEIKKLEQDSVLILPDYSEFIPAMDRRRMSEVIKMSIACSLDCLSQAGISQPDGIIVGTSMGCCSHTKNFLDKIIAAKEGPLSPTSFIVSTHNTIAGQISLLLKNHGYNMTHTQNTLSFEQALIDAMLCIENGAANMLVGGADEEENAIYNMKARLNNQSVHLTSGAAFFVLSRDKQIADAIRLKDVGSFGLINDPTFIIAEFLAANNIPLEEVDHVLYAENDESYKTQLIAQFGQEKLVDYQQLTGTYYTSPALALHYGIDILLSQPVKGKHLKRVLICNNLIKENLGLILIDKSD